MPRGEPYLGKTRKLVLAIDVGTTYSGVSYCIMDPGKVPEVLSVVRFPGQEGENRARDTKIPSVLYYDEDGEICAIGAEAVSEGTKIQAEEEEWVRAEWFKLRLCPGGVQAKGERLPRICVDKSVVQIFADYLGYVFKCATDYICDSHPLGRQVVESGTDIEFILSHPNGWGGRQQGKLRRAMIEAGLIPDTEAGRARIHFVSEGEACLHFCIVNGLADELVKKDNHIMIVDAGGGTVDLSTYRVVKVAPLNIVESSAPDCLLQGSTFINSRARLYLEGKLEKSRFSNDDFLDSMLENFDSGAKPTYRDQTKTSYIKFGGPRDTDEKYGIKRGVLSLSGTDMLQLFRPSVDAIKRAIDKQLELAGGHVSAILLVGGFAGSPFLRSQLQDYARKNGLVLFFPEHQTAKAVAEGALWFHLDHFVSARIAKSVYGTDSSISFNSTFPGHKERITKVYMDLEGQLCVRDAFNRIISRGELVTEEREFKATFVWNRLISYSHSIEAPIIAYQGLKEDPQWTDEESEMFYTLCHVRATVPQQVWKPKQGTRGTYYSAHCDVILLFGLTEFKAQLSWTENGQEHRSEAVIVYDDEDEDSDS